MSTYTDERKLMKAMNELNCETLFNELTKKKVPENGKLGNRKHRDSFSRVYQLYLALHEQYHATKLNDIENLKLNLENYRVAIVQALHGQPYHNLPNLPQLCDTNFVSKDAQKLIDGGKKPTIEHVYPRNRTLKLDLFDPKTPLTFKQFLCHYVSKGGKYARTSSKENRKLRKFHRENPNAIKDLHWEVIYEMVGIEEHKDNSYYDPEKYKD